MYWEWLEGQPWESHVSKSTHISGRACWTVVLMNSLMNWETKRPRAKNMPWISRRKMKWETNPPRLMKTGTSETQAKKWPSWSPFRYRTWVSVTAFSGGVAMAEWDGKIWVNVNEWITEWEMVFFFFFSLLRETVRWKLKCAMKRKKKATRGCQFREGVLLLVVSFTCSPFMLFSVIFCLWIIG